MDVLTWIKRGGRGRADRVAREGGLDGVEAWAVREISDCKFFVLLPSLFRSYVVDPAGSDYPLWANHGRCFVLYFGLFAVWACFLLRAGMRHEINPGVAGVASSLTGGLYADLRRRTLPLGYTEYCCLFVLACYCERQPVSS
jgi:hypothetical protein